MSDVVARTDSELVVFRVGELSCAINIEWVQEVNKHLDVTSIPQSPETVRGIVNLRGQIVTIVDLRRVLGLPARAVDGRSRSVILRHRGEAVGLLVDEVDDIISASSHDFAPPPAHLEASLGSLLQAVYRTEQQLVAILAVERLWSDEPIARSNAS